MPRGNRRQATPSAPAPTSARKSNQFVTAVARAFTVLQAFRAGDDLGLSNKELAARTRLSAPTVSRLCHTLQALGYLSYAPDSGRYQLGPAVLTLSYVLLRSLDVRQVARPFLRAFAEETGVTVGINARDRLRMVVLEGVSGTSPVALRLEVGSRIPIVSTAAGRAYLAGLVVAGAEEQLAEIRAADPDGWRSNQTGIHRAVEQVRQRGFCISQGGWQRTINGVAVPLMLPRTQGLLSLSCGGPAQDLTVRRMEQTLGPRLLEIARELNRRIPH